MSLTVDANVLLYASDASSRYHDRALAALRHVAEGPEIVYLFWPVAMAYLRISTHPAVFEAPLAPGEAIANLDSLLARPNVRAPGEAEDFWALFSQIATEARPRGNMIPDTHIAALMRQHGVVTVLTHDRDFRRFDGIRVRDPFA